MTTDPKKARADAEKQLDEDDDKREEASTAAAQAAAKVKPTPSQRESDLARLGVLHPDDREPSGAPPEAHAKKPAPPASAPSPSKAPERK